MNTYCNNTVKHVALCTGGYLFLSQDDGPCQDDIILAGPPSSWPARMISYFGRQDDFASFLSNELRPLPPAPTAICCLLACWPAGLLAVGSFKILYCACAFLTKKN